MKRRLILGTLMIALSILLLPQIAVALPTNPNSMNARFIKWQEKDYVIHILVYADAGRPGQPAAEVSVGQPVLFGFEWAYGTIEELQNLIIDNPLHDIFISVDGGTPVSVKSWYQDPFEAVPGSGPRRNWDHDGDGLGDRDGDGVYDWDGPTLFFRYQHEGLTAGIHYFVFNFTDDGGLTWYWDTLTVNAS